MKKIIRLTESDLVRMIKRVVKDSINESMNNDIVLIDDEDINEEDIVKKEEFTNKYGERIIMIEMSDGEVLIKHSDVNEKFMLFDSLIQKSGDHYRLRIYFNEEERGYIASFFNGTNYESLIPGLSVR
jgi:rRNA pseudouridine-1189 N-methylase Emg1 (Nep1/Mra1 family)